MPPIGVPLSNFNYHNTEILGDFWSQITSTHPIDDFDSPASHTFSFRNDVNAQTDAVNLLCREMARRKPPSFWRRPQLFVYLLLVLGGALISRQVLIKGDFFPLQGRHRPSRFLHPLIYFAFFCSPQVLGHKIDV